MAELEVSHEQQQEQLGSHSVMNEPELDGNVNGGIEIHQHVESKDDTHEVLLAPRMQSSVQQEFAVEENIGKENEKDANETVPDEARGIVKGIENEEKVGEISNEGAVVSSKDEETVDENLVGGGEVKGETSEVSSKVEEKENGSGVTFEVLPSSDPSGDDIGAGGKKKTASKTLKTAPSFGKMLARVSSKSGGVVQDEQDYKNTSMSARTKSWGGLIKRTQSETLNELASDANSTSENNAEEKELPLPRGESAPVDRKAFGRNRSSRKDLQAARSKRKAVRNPRSIIEMRREPALHMAPYGQFWSMDVFSLPHNAIRRELLDCYIILYAMDVRRLELTSKDIASFFQWWTVFVKFFEVYLDAEDVVLYPWIESGVKLSGLLEAKKRAKIKEHLRLILGLLTNAEAKLIKMAEDDGEPVFLMKRAVDKISLLTQEYFVAQERVIPRMLGSVYTLKDKRAYDRRFINFLLKSEQSGFNVALVSRWLQPDVRQPKQLLEWRYDNLGPINWTRYGIWYKQVESKHIKVLAYFRAKRDAFLEEEKYKKALFKSDPEEFIRRYGEVDKTAPDTEEDSLNASQGITSASDSAVDDDLQGVEKKKVVESVQATEKVAESAVEGNGGEASAVKTEDAVSKEVQEGPEGEEAKVEQVADSAVVAAADVGESEGEVKIGDEVEKQIEEYETNMTSHPAYMNTDDLLSLKTDDYADSVVLEEVLSLQGTPAPNAHPKAFAVNRSASDDVSDALVARRRASNSSVGRPPAAMTSKAATDSTIARPVVVPKPPSAAPSAGVAGASKPPVIKPPTAAKPSPSATELDRILMTTTPAANKWDLQEFLDADDDSDDFSGSYYTSSSRRDTIQSTSSAASSSVNYADAW